MELLTAALLLEHLGWTEEAERVEAAVARYLATGAQAPETMFDHLHAELPNAYRGQRDELERAFRA